MDRFIEVDARNFRSDEYTAKLKAVINRGIENGKQELAERTKAKVIENMVLYGLGTSKLINNVVVVMTKYGMVINVANEYATFVEFGTGIVGKENPHPKPMGWRYDTNSHGEKGWFYPTTPDDPNPWKHTYNGQLYGWTKGQASRPFMYGAWLWARQSYTQIIKKNIREEISKARR